MRQLGIVFQTEIMAIIAICEPLREVTEERIVICSIARQDLKAHKTSSAEKNNVKTLSN